MNKPRASLRSLKKFPECSCVYCAGHCAHLKPNMMTGGELLSLAYHVERCTLPTTREVHTLAIAVSLMLGAVR